MLQLCKFRTHCRSSHTLPLAGQSSPRSSSPAAGNAGNVSGWSAAACDGPRHQRLCFLGKPEEKQKQDFTVGDVKQKATCKQTNKFFPNSCLLKQKKDSHPILTGKYGWKKGNSHLLTGKKNIILTFQLGGNSNSHLHTGKNYNLQCLTTEKTTCNSHIPNRKKPTIPTSWEETVIPI